MPLPAVQRLMVLVSSHRYHELALLWMACPAVDFSLLLVDVP